MAPAPLEQNRALEDPLAYLPCSTIIDYRKGQTIYGRDQPPTGVYLVIDGRVEVCRNTDDRRLVVVDIYQADEFFGESVFVGESRCPETATALVNAKLMVWTTNTIEELATKRPRLAIALVQLLVQRSMDFASRIESFSMDTIPRRLARALIRFSERLGEQREDGYVQMTPLTHELLSRYVGTSREVVTSNMLRFRREGYLRYSRKSIDLHPHAMKDWLRHDAESSCPAESKIEQC